MICRKRENKNKSIINEKNINEKELKPDILYINEEELILIKLAVYFENKVEKTIRKKEEKYKKLFNEIIKLYKTKNNKNITVIVTVSGILTTLSRNELKEVDIEINEVKIMEEILRTQFEYLININRKIKFINTK